MEAKKDEAGAGAKPRGARRPASITTRVGDRGTTFLFSGEEVPKDSPRTDAYGDLDELVSVLGIARCHSGRGDVREILLVLQRELFVIGAELATTPEHADLLGRRCDEAMLADFEARRERLEAAIAMPGGFIVPGGTLAAAHIDHARTIARRLERRLTGLVRGGLVRNPSLQVWVNRLSDFLWLLARHEEGGATVPK
jgi:cob(I)alamin adenosyltransferase